jgi:hypothetical protein
MKRPRVDMIEIHPLVGLDISGNIVNHYDDAETFDHTDESDPNIICYGVFLHREGEGMENVFDTPNKREAERAEDLLNKLYNL